MNQIYRITDIRESGNEGPPACSFPSNIVDLAMCWNPFLAQIGRSIDPASHTWLVPLKQFFSDVRHQFFSIMPNWASKLYSTHPTAPYVCSNTGDTPVVAWLVLPTSFKQNRDNNKEKHKKIKPFLDTRQAKGKWLIPILSTVRLQCHKQF